MSNSKLIELSYYDPSAQVRLSAYEGLLARTAEEQKKRKSKKAEVDENQLSIFGFAA